MNDRIDDFRNRHDGMVIPRIWVAVAVSILLHIALLWRLPPVIVAQQIDYGTGTLLGHWDAWQHGRGRERFTRLTR